MLKIYKITKESDPMSIYIGQTIQNLRMRFSAHKCEAKRTTNIKLYQWLDTTCKIELIEEISNENSNIREMEIIQEFINNGYKVMNERVGNHILDPKGNKIKHSNNRHSEYISWQNEIARKAKKECLSSKEYRLKYNILDYTGPKKIK